MTSTLMAAISLALWSVPVCSGLLQRPVFIGTRSAEVFRLHSQKQNSAQQERPANEFSRVYHTESILATNNREYRVEVAATAEELQALSKRFSLPEISSLAASLSIRKHSSAAARKGTTSARGLAVEVQGSLQSQLKQICVRTGQPFEVDLEFPVQVVVRPMYAATSAYDDSSEDVEQNDGSRKQRNPQKQQQQPRSLDDVSMMELQRMLQDIDLSEDVFEDDAIYDAGSKQLDVGELVAQFLFVNLDPYPKRPGTNPIQISISG